MRDGAIVARWANTTTSNCPIRTVRLEYPVYLRLTGGITFVTSGIAEVARRLSARLSNKDRSGWFLCHNLYPSIEDRRDTSQDVARLVSRRPRSGRHAAIGWLLEEQDGGADAALLDWGQAKALDAIDGGLPAGRRT